MIGFLFFFFCIHRSRFRCFIACFVHPSSMFRFVTCFAFPFVLPMRRTFPAEFSGHCSLISFPVRSLGHCLFGFLRLCLFLFCAFGSLLCNFPASSLVPLGTSLSSSGSAALLRSPLGLPVLSFASLQSWASSLIVVLYSVSGLLVGSHSLSVLLSAASVCVCLLPFLPVFVSSASPCCYFDSGPCSLLFSDTFVMVLLLFWGVHPFALCICLVGICSLVSEWACFLLWGFGAFVHRSSPSVIGVFFFALFCVAILVSVVLLPHSDLRFPSRRGLPLG